MAEHRADSRTPELQAAVERAERAEKARDTAYILMIDTSSFLRGYGDVAELAASRLVHAVPEDFDDREEAARAALAPGYPE